MCLFKNILLLHFNTTQEKVAQLLVKIEDLNHNMPKNIAKKMEYAAKMAAEAELNLNGKDDKTAKCVIC
jgi:hypothetical protein